MPASSIVANAEGVERGTLHCEQCASQVLDVELKRGEVLVCGRCKSPVKRYRPLGAEQAACALALAGLILLAWANVLPIMTFQVTQMAVSNEIVTGILVLASAGYWPIALLVFFCAMVAPTAYFVGVAYSAGACVTGRTWLGAERAARMARAVQPWSLLPVFALACLVSAVKLDLIGHVIWEPGVLLIGLVAVVTLLLDTFFDADQVVRQLHGRRIVKS